MNRNRALAVVLSVLMVLAMVPGLSFAEDSAQASSATTEDAVAPPAVEMQAESESAEAIVPEGLEAETLNAETTGESVPEQPAPSTVEGAPAIEATEASPLAEVQSKPDAVNPSDLTAGSTATQEEVAVTEEDIKSVGNTEKASGKLVLTVSLDAANPAESGEPPAALVFDYTITGKHYSQEITVVANGTEPVTVILPWGDYQIVQKASPHANLQTTFEGLDDQNLFTISKKNPEATVVVLNTIRAPEAEVTEELPAEEEMALAAGISTDPSNITSVKVTKHWEGVPADTNPVAVIELYDAEEPDAVIRTAELTPADSSVLWGNLPYSDGNGHIIEYRIREQAIPGYESSAPVKSPATISSIVRETSCNTLGWQIKKPSFVAAKPTKGGPVVVWTLNHLPTTDREAFLDNFLKVAASLGGHLGPFANLDIADNIMWVEGSSVDVDIFPADPKTGRVTINVLYSEDGSISSSSLVFQGESTWTQFLVGTYSGQEIELTNTYVPIPGFVLAGTKALEGADIGKYDGKFNFELYESTAAAETGQLVKTVSNTTGAFTFGELNFSQVGTYYYLIKEVSEELGGVTYDQTQYLVKVVVAQSGSVVSTTAAYYPVVNGQVAQGPVEGVTFKNKYSAEETSVTIQGTKELSGRTLANGEFRFALYKADEQGNATGDAIETVPNTGGTFSFQALSYTAVGTHDYVIKEVNGSLGGVTYDETAFKATVTVTDDGNGNLVAAVSYPGGAPAFKNTYEAVETTATLGGTKALSGRDLKDKEFSFALYSANAAGGVEEKLQTETNVAGAFTFAPLTYTTTGIYYYVVKEEVGTLGGVIYDTKSYQVKVVVTDNGTGQLVAATTYYPIIEGVVGTEPVASLTFNNTYKAEGSAVLAVLKALSGRTLQAEEFSFELRGATGALLQTTKNLANGDVVFDKLSYTLADAGKTFEYTINEVIPDPKATRMTYDESIMTVKVKVSDVGDGTLKTEVIYPEDKTFNNSYRTGGGGGGGLTPDYIPIKGVKTWAQDTEADRPTSIAVILLQDGKEIKRLAVTKADNWAYDFGSQISKEISGVAHTYKVEEIVPEGYAATYNGYDITNTKTGILGTIEEYVDVKGVKTWQDNDAADRPIQITVILMKDGKEVGRKAVSKATGWAYDFGRLISKETNGTTHTYQVVEVVPKGYKAVYDGFNVTNVKEQGVLGVMDNPLTGDSGIALALILMLLGIFALGALMIGRRKARRAGMNKQN